MDDPPNTTDYDSTTQSSNVTEMFTNATDADDNPGDDYDDYSDAETARMVHVIGRPILIVLGTIGNCLAFYVMRKGSLKNVSTCFYMAILALADTGKFTNGSLVPLSRSAFPFWEILNPLCTHLPDPDFPS